MSVFYSCVIMRVFGGGVEDAATSVRVSLLRWYEGNARVLPWRKPPPSDPTLEEDAEQQRHAYAVWVSEIMLQQTRVQTVIDYFQRWMKEFPSVQALAAAKNEKVNELWAGLGYYRRAMNLLAGARTVVDTMGGRIPNTKAELLKIPGIGEYTAGAISSIAFGQQEPVLDGNVIRVISRLEAIEEFPSNSAQTKMFWDLASQLTGVGPRPGDFNQALMELGATVCTPRNPNCKDCPVKDACQGLHKLGTPGVEELPRKAPKAKPREERVATAVLWAHPPEWAQRRCLMIQRPATGLLASLWEFPSVALPGESTTPADQVSKKQMRVHQELLLGFLQTGDLGGVAKGQVQQWELLGESSHVFSHIRQHMLVYSGQVLSPVAGDTAAPGVPVSLLDLQGSSTGGSSAEAAGSGQALALSLLQPCKEEKVGGISPSRPDVATASSLESRHWRWLTEEEVQEAAVSSGTKKVLRLATRPVDRASKPPKTGGRRSRTRDGATAASSSSEDPPHKRQLTLSNFLVGAKVESK